MTHRRIIGGAALVVLYMGAVFGGTIIVQHMHAPPAPPPPPLAPQQSDSLRWESGYQPDHTGIAHDDTHHVTCWYEMTCPGNYNTGCGTAMTCLPDKELQ